MKNRLIFRADGNPQVGAGHVMRCLSIADAAGSEGMECVFLTASGDFCQTIAAHGHEAVVLGTDYRCMDSEDTEALMNRFQPMAVFVDSYHVTAAYLLKLQDICEKSKSTLFFLDDIAAFPYPCDILINYNIFARESTYQDLYRASDVMLPRLLLGTSFAPLRKEFARLPVRNVRKKAEHVLVSTGGADSEHLTIPLVREAGAMERSSLFFDFIVGAMNPDKERLRKLAADLPNVALHENVTDMAGIMNSCDAAVSAAGSTLYELCATQTPTVTYILADNQIPGAEGFGDGGARIMKNCGDIRKLGKEELASTLIREVSELAGDYGKRAKIAEKMRAVVDGRGAFRILENLEGV